MELLEITKFTANTVLVEAVGRCRITIKNDETGEVVYDEVWLLGTAAECKRLAKEILDDFNG